MDQSLPCGWWIGAAAMAMVLIIVVGGIAMQLWLLSASGALVALWVMWVASITPLPPSKPGQNEVSR